MGVGRGVGSQVKKRVWAKLWNWALMVECRGHGKSPDGRSIKRKLLKLRLASKLPGESLIGTSKMWELYFTDRTELSIILKLERPLYQYFLPFLFLPYRGFYVLCGGCDRTTTTKKYVEPGTVIPGYWECKLVQPSWRKSWWHMTKLLRHLLLVSESHV